MFIDLFYTIAGYTPNTKTCHTFRDAVGVVYGPERLCTWFRMIYDLLKSKWI